MYKRQLSTPSELLREFQAIDLGIATSPIAAPRVTNSLSPRGVDEFYGAMDEILMAKQDEAAKTGTELDLEDMKDVVYDTRQKCLRDAEDAVEVEKAICDNVMKEVLVSTGMCAKLARYLPHGSNALWSRLSKMPRPLRRFRVLNATSNSGCSRST